MKTQQTALLLLVAVPLLSAQTSEVSGGGRRGGDPARPAPVDLPIRTVVSSQNLPFQPGKQNGDTNQYSAWTASNTGGNFNGGHVYGMSGDADFGGSNTGNHILFTELVSYDPANPANTKIVLVNSMESYGVAGAGNCFNVSPNFSCSGYMPFSLGDNIYLPVHSQTGGPSWKTLLSSIIVSPDHGLHWCNYLTYTSGHNSCTSANWKADGDMPLNDAGIQWVPAGGDWDATGKMGKLTFVQIGQDGAAPPAIAGVDTSFHYVLSNTGDNTNLVHHIYAHRFIGDPMLPGNWTHWNGRSWVKNPDDCVAIEPPAWSSHINFSQSVMYAVDDHRFYMSTNNDGAGGPMVMASSKTPWGPWTELPPMDTPTMLWPTQFSTFMLSTYKTIVPGKRFQVAISGNRDASDPAPWKYVVGFVTVDFNLPREADVSKRNGLDR
jgi:hypothetical protein